MKSSYALLICILIASAFPVAGSDLPAEELQLARKTPYDPEPSATGAAPPPLDLSHLRPAARLDSIILPDVWNWIDEGGVSVVKNQMNFGACWAFTAIADIESKVMINEGPEYDYSELNVISCNSETGGYTGGNTVIAMSYLSVLGTVLESCEPYPGTLPNHNCINPGCAFYKTVTEWRMIPSDVTAIKEAIYTYGPVQAIVHMDETWSGYDGTYCFYGPNGTTNHNVLIVGWDDVTCGGTWIIKNSYGIVWGGGGYGFVLYNHNSIESYVSTFTAYKDFDPDETVYYYDDFGWMNAAGFGDGIDWGLVEITPSSNDYLAGVNIWITSSPASYEIYVYDSFDGSSVSDLLSGPASGDVTEAGFYTAELPMAVPVTSGDPVYIAVRFNTPGYAYPIPYDDYGPMETNKSYISNSGSSYGALDAGDISWGDIGIRGRTAPSLDRGDPGWYVDFHQDETIASPGDVIQRTIGLANFGGLSSAGCQEDDDFCFHIENSLGWTIICDPPPETIFSLPAGYLNYIDVDIMVPCDASLDSQNVVTIYISYWEDGECQMEQGDCENPSIYSSTEYYSEDTFIVNVIEREAPMHIEDNPWVMTVNEGQWPSGVLFRVYNDDPCTPLADFHYIFTSRGHIGEAIYQGGTVEDVPSGECKSVYAVLDAREAVICDRDTITMVCWDAATESFYDTSQTAVHVTEYSDAPDDSDTPAAFSLAQNHPNPFNPATEIRYSLAEGCHVKLEIFDVRGRKVKTLVNRVQEAGYRTAVWDGRDDSGLEMGSGVYFCRIVAGDFTDSKKMILLR
jgi:C1A family cysteine protease